MGGANNQEIEVKFYLCKLEDIDLRLKGLQAEVVQTRTHEYNLRFDTPGGELSRSFQVIRLRRDTASRLTYKGHSRVVDGVSLRDEIEFTVGDFEEAKSFLEALGYQVSLVYEKFRRVYAFGGVFVTLDELPFGDFVEIEGPDGASIRAVSRELGLDWEVRIVESYAALFQTARRNLGLKMTNLTFETFELVSFLPDDLGVQPADAP